MQNVSIHLLMLVALLAISSSGPTLISISKKRIELGDAVQEKITSQKKSWSQKREYMETDINEETYSYEFIDFIFKI